jgi:hypothetical protein
MFKGLWPEVICLANPSQGHPLDALLRCISFILKNQIIYLIFLDPQALQHIIYGFAGDVSTIVQMRKLDQGTLGRGEVVDVIIKPRRSKRPGWTQQKILGRILLNSTSERIRSVEENPSRERLILYSSIAFEGSARFNLAA